MSGAQLQPHQWYPAPTRVSDVEGGFELTLGTPAVVYLQVVYHDNNLIVYCRKETELLNGSILLIDGKEYVVTGIRRAPTLYMKQVEVEARKRPIESAV